jgi:hypothetical protein
LRARVLRSKIRSNGESASSGFSPSGLRKPTTQTILHARSIWQQKSNLCRTWGDYEEFYLSGYNTLYFTECQTAVSDKRVSSIFRVEE